MIKESTKYLTVIFLLGASPSVRSDFRKNLKQKPTDIVSFTFDFSFVFSGKCILHKYNWSKVKRSRTNFKLGFAMLAVGLMI